MIDAGLPAGSILRAVREKDKPSTYPKGRRCQSCPTVLSIYNGGAYCGRCSPTAGPPGVAAAETRSNSQSNTVQVVNIL